ncbi:MAG TPA: hypothetical protein VFM46_11515, partial [Pseudomonadales bacterium]|nr:hypothetical protein [Pseudomonadales bacterium]
YHASCEECFKRALRNSPNYWSHMQQLKGMRDRFDRRMYLDGVEVAEGYEMAQLLQKDFGEWFEAQRKAREEKAKA